MKDEPKFVIDTMLGRLARWLRILGYDVVYHRKMEDWKILRLADEENRIIITRDRGLHRRAMNKGLKSILLETDDMAERLAIIAFRAGIRLYIDLDRTRCPICNTPLIRVDKEKVKDIVPPRVYRLHDDFWLCPKCHKAYWVGSHWNKIEEILREARKIYEKIKKERMREISWIET